MKADQVALKFFIGQNNGKHSFNSVAVTGDPAKDVVILEETARSPHFVRWREEGDKIEGLLPPEPYETWGAFFAAWKASDDLKLSSLRFAESR